VAGFGEMESQVGGEFQVEEPGLASMQLSRSGDYERGELYLLTHWGLCALRLVYLSALRS
jgi:hypothetical protein